MKRLIDMRSNIKTLEDADALMNTIAAVTCTVELEEARAEKKILQIKLQHEAKVEPVKADLKIAEANLAAFILANKDLFKRPRKRKCEGGSYGLQTAKGVDIFNEEQLVQYCLDCGYDNCLEPKYKPVKAEIEKRLKDKEGVPGAILKTGDTAVYRVEPALIKKATAEVCE